MNLVPEMAKMVIFDFDGTLIRRSVSLELARKFGFYHEIKELHRSVLNGEIELEKGLKRAYDYFKGFSYNLIIDYTKEIEWLKGVNETVEHLKNKGYKLAIMSIGTPKNIVEEMIKFKDLSFNYVFGNKISVKNGVISEYITGELMHVNSKASVFRNLLEEVSINPENCVAVADDIFNIPLFNLVNFGIAINAQRSLKEIADIVVETDDLRDILPYL